MEAELSQAVKDEVVRKAIIKAAERIEKEAHQATMECIHCQVRQEVLLVPGATHQCVQCGGRLVLVEPDIPEPVHGAVMPALGIQVTTSTMGAVTTASPIDFRMDAAHYWGLTRQGEGVFGF